MSCKKCGLVSFDGEVVMGLTFSDQVVGELALGQEGIGGNVFALDIDGIKERDGHLDLVGVLDLFITFYGQEATFFGCSRSWSDDR